MNAERFTGNAMDPQLADLVRRAAHDVTFLAFAEQEVANLKWDRIDALLGLAGQDVTPENRTLVRKALGIPLVTEEMRKASFGKGVNTLNTPMGGTVTRSLEGKLGVHIAYPTSFGYIKFWPNRYVGDKALETFFTPSSALADNPHENVYPALIHLGKRYTATYGVSSADVEDFAQSALIALWDKAEVILNTYHAHGGATAAGLVKTIAERAMKDHALAYGYAARLTVDGTRKWIHWLDMDPERQPARLTFEAPEDPGTGDVPAVVDALLDHVDAKIVLLAWAGYSNAEIAPMVGKPTETVKKARQRALGAILSDLAA